MDKAATARTQGCAKTGFGSGKRRAMWASFMVLLVIGLVTSGFALAATTLAVDLKGVTPSGLDTWLSLPMTARFDVAVGGVTVGQVTANPTAEQRAQSQSDTIALADGVSDVTLLPVAEDFQDGFVCEGPVAVQLTQGEENTATVLAYAKRGFFRVTGAAEGDAATGAAEYAVLDAAGNVALSFTSDEKGAYTAAQSLPAGDYQLAQMRAPEGMLLLSQPVPFTVLPYNGTQERIANVQVVNQRAPLYNGQTGTLALATSEFARQGGVWNATITVTGLCDGSNDLPLAGYALTVGPVERSDQTGSFAAADGVGISAVTVRRPDGLPCAAQALDASGAPVGEPVQCENGQQTALQGAAGVRITYLNAQGEVAVPAGFQGGDVTLNLTSTQTDAAQSNGQAAKVRVPASVAYTYQYPGADGISKVTAQSAVAPSEARLAMPDGKIRLTASATQATLADGTVAVTLAQLAQTPDAEPLTVAAALPQGARVNADALPDGFVVLRTETYDMVVFSTSIWASAPVQIPLAAGAGDAVTVWVFDPASLPATAADPEGFLLRAEEHAPQPLLDALAGHAGGLYARYDALLPGGFATGNTASGLVPLASGTVCEADRQPAATDAGLGALLTGASAKVLYGAVTDESGHFAISGDAAQTVGDLRVALPPDAADTQGGTAGYAALAGLALPKTDIALTYTRLCALHGSILRASGAPLAGVTVSLLQNGQPVRQAETAQNGAYTMDAFPEGVYSLTLAMPQGVSATITAPEGLTRQPDGTYLLDGISFAYGERRELSLTAALLGTVQGTVTENGAPVAGLSATLSDASGQSLTAQTNDSGVYGFASLPAGDYRLTLTLPQHTVASAAKGAASAGQYVIDYTVSEGAAIAEPITLEATGALRGTVSGLAAGQTVTAASVDAQLTATTAQDGSFAFDSLVSGDYTLYAPLPDGMTVAGDTDWRVTERGDMIWLTAHVAAGETGELPKAALTAATGVEGVAYMDANGDRACGDGEQLMSGVPVALQRMQGGTWTDIANSQTDEYGHYAFLNLTEGEYRVVSQAVDGLSVTAVGKSATALGEPALGVVAGDSFTLRGGETAKGNSDIALSEPASLAVAAFADSNENGMRGIYERAIPGVTIEVVPAAAPDGASVAQGVTGTDGNAAIGNIPAGRYVLRVTLPDGYQYTTARDAWSLEDSCVGDTQGLTARSGEIDLTSGRSAAAGVAAIPVGSFSGRVWNDKNNNGIMDEGEPGVPGVTLTLRGLTLKNTYTIQTGDTGDYRFGNLRDDMYEFTAQVPEGMLFAHYSQTGGDSRSVFTVDTASATRQFEIDHQLDVKDKNVGLIDSAVIHGIAFLDTNYNGLYDEGEPPYAGVTLEVIKNSNQKSMGKAVTGEDGLYTFSALRGNDYRLRAILPADGSIFTMVPEGAQGLANLFAAREGRRENSIPSIKVANGETAETCVGVAMGGTITGTVSQDAKYDGIRNGSDKKVQGIPVQLVDAAGVVAATDNTNESGRYTLTGIMPGTYTVRVQRRDGYAFTRYRPDEENGNHIKTLAKDGFGETEPIQIAMGQTIDGIDAGMLPSSTLTGVLFDDLNDNGLRDEGENGFTAAKVRLLSSDGDIDLTEPVAEDGTYFFDGVMPGEYTVTYQLPYMAEMAKVAEGGNTLAAGGDENVLSGFKAESGKAYTAPLVGAVTLGSFSATVYHDKNGNSVRDEGEETLAGATATLTRKDGAADAATATSADDGVLLIEALRPGAYTLALALPDGYIFSADIAESGLTLPAAQQAEPACTWETLTNRAQNTVGAVMPATIRASVWLDEDRDGAHQEGERLLDGLTFALYDEARGLEVGTATADADGIAAFDSVRPGTYTVRFALPAQAEPAASGGAFTLQGSLMAHSGITVGEGETAQDISGGLVSRTSIGGTVSLDANGTRTAQAGVSVSLYEGDGDQPVQTAVTDENGGYRFNGLWPDIYTLRVSLPTGMVFVRADDANYKAGESAVTSTQDGVGLSDAISLQMAQHQLNVNVLMIEPAVVGGQAWLDANQNGLIDADEPPLGGVDVQLLMDGTVRYETQTNAWGYYEFADVYPGTYTLSAKAYPELAVTTPVPALALISSCLTSGNGTQASSDPLTVASGSSGFSYGLGYILPDGTAMPSGITTAPVQNWAK